MKRRDLEKMMRDFGWELARHGARHDVWAKGELEIPIPRHAEINEYTAKAILKEAGGKKR